MTGLRPIGGDGNFGTIQKIRNVFRNAPVNNPDGTTGITAYIKVDEQVPFETQTNTTGLKLIKNKFFGNATERADPNRVNLLAAKAYAFHYAVFANSQPPPNSGSSGVSDGIPGMNFLMTLGGTWVPIGGSLDEQEGTFLHELGHNLGLRHAGDTNGPHCKINYFSVMNYLFQFSDNVASRPLDYSRSALAPLDKNNLNEPAGIGQSTPANLTTIIGPVGPRQGPEYPTAGRAVDWNFDGDTIQTSVRSDINAGLINPPPPNPPACGFPGPGTVLNGFNDWPNIIYIDPPQQQQQVLGTSQQQTSPPERELTINDVRESRVVLLEGINNAIARLASAPPSARAADIKEIKFEIRNLVGALKSEELTTSTSSPSPVGPTATTTTAPITTTSMTAIPTTSSSSIHTIASLSPPPAAVPPALSQNPTGGGAGSVDTTHIAQLLKTDRLNTAIGQLNNLLTQVITSQLVQSQQQPQQQGQLLQSQIQQPNSNLSQQLQPLQQQLQQQVPRPLTPGSNSNSSTNASPIPAISNSRNNNNKNK